MKKIIVILIISIMLVSMMIVGSTVNSIAGIEIPEPKSIRV